MLYRDYRTMSERILRDEEGRKRDEARNKSLQTNSRVRPDCNPPSSQSIQKPPLLARMSSTASVQSSSASEIISPDILRYLATIPIQPRRSLDQFGYPALDDTRARDADQTISKWTGSNLGSEGHTNAANDSVLIMVDQFWCWILDHSKH
jgi:hypothetical protein